MTNCSMDKILKLSSFFRKKVFFVLAAVTVVAGGFFVAQKSLADVSFGNVPFNDGFESHAFGTLWNASPAWSVTSGDNHSGTGIYKAESKGVSGHPDENLTLSMSTANTRDISVSYWYHVNSTMVAGDSVVAQYSVDGTTFVPFRTYTDLSPMSDWAQDSFAFPVAASDNSNLKIRFVSKLDKAADHFFLDDVSVTGTHMPSVSQSTVVASETNVPTQGGITTITITVKDANGNPIVGVVPTLVSNGTGNTIAPTVLNATNSLGQTTATMQSSVAEIKTLTVTVLGAELLSRPTVTFYASDARSAVIVATPADPEASRSGSTSNLKITIKDQSGNPVPAGVRVFLYVSSVSDGTVTIPPDLLTENEGIIHTQVSFNNKGLVNLSLRHDTTGNLNLSGDSIISFKDRTIPTIDITGANPSTVEYRTTYADAGATALDNIDGYITSSIHPTNNVNTNVTNVSSIDSSNKIVGVYSVKYNVKDGSNNSADEVTRTVNVVDTTAPVLTSVTSDGTESKLLKIGNKITFTVTPSVAEPVATVSGSYNGQDLTWSTSDSGVTYHATYTINEGQTDQPTPLQISGITMTDEAGNTSAPIPGYDVTDTIDANTPVAPTLEMNPFVNFVNQTLVILGIHGESGTKVAYKISDSSTHFVEGTGVVDSTGIFTTMAHNLSGFVDGTITAIARLTDNAENISADGSTTAIKDVVAPGAPTVVANPFINTENETHFSITGTGEANATIAYEFRDATKTVLGIGTVSSTGNIDLVSPDLTGLSDGVVTLVMKLTDAAGNTGNESNTSLTKETVKPTLVSIDIDGKIFKAGTYTVTAVASEIVTLPKFAVTYTNTSGTCANIPATAMIATTEPTTFTYELDIPDSCDGATGTVTYSNATDVAGNIVTSDSTHSFIVDTLAPVFSATSPVIDAYVKADFSVSYTLSEQLANGAITFVNGATTQTYHLIAADLTPGVHILAGTSLGLTFVDGETYAISFAGTDLAGNDSAVVTNTNVRYDTTAPTVIDVTSSTIDGEYKATDPITILVKMSEPVITANGITLSLETGTTDRAATYVGGSGTEELTFVYTVQSGDISADLSTIALALNSQSIRDFAGNDANLTLPTDDHSLNSNKKIIVDAIPPVYTTHADMIAEATSAAGAVVEFTKPVVHDQIHIEGTSLSNVCVKASGETFAIGDTTVTCTATDDLGNFAVTTFNVKVHDTTAPSITAPADITMDANGDFSTVSLGTPVVSDVVDATPTVTSNAPTSYPIGTTVITWTAVDDYGNTNTAAQSVTIVPAPIAKLSVSAESPVSAGTMSTITIVGKDAFGHKTTNQSGSVIVVSADNGASLSDTIVTLSNGEASTATTKSAAGVVNVSVSSGTLVPATTKITFTPADVIAPTVTAFSPAKDALNVSVTAPIFVTFSEPLKSTTITSANIKLMKVGEGTDSAVTATVALIEGGSRVSIVPASDLDFSAHYYLNINSAVTDEAGNVLVAGLDKTNTGFTTEQNTADLVKPTVVAQYPAVSASNVAITANPTVDFSEAMMNSTLSTANIKLIKGTGEEIPVTLSTENGGTRVILKPVSPLSYTSTYHILVTTGVTDEAGNALSENFTGGSFQTGVESAILEVTSVSALNTYAIADNSFNHGWKWIFNVTVPTIETKFFMKFSDFVSGLNILPAGGNVRYYSAQSSNATSGDTAVNVSTADTYPESIMQLNGDTDAIKPGRQIQVTVETKIPEGTAGGSYSTGYGVKSLPEN